MRHYRHTRFQHNLKQRHPKQRHPKQRSTVRSNPLKPKLLNKRLEELQQLGLDAQHTQTLIADLSAANVDPANAIYVLEWWKARLSLLLFLKATDDHGQRIVEEKIYNALLDNLQRYMLKYKLTAHEMALDAELQIDYWGELQHFLQMSGANPYFKIEWPSLHKVLVELPVNRYNRQGLRETERTTWLGRMAKENTKLSDNRHGFEKGSPAIKLLRGAYIGDPVGVEEHTELPKEAIVLMEETFKPSDVIAFLKDAEANLEVSTFFIPQYHEPFLSFSDGKAWTVIASQDRENEKQSLGDCATGEYTDNSIIVISLREPVMTSPQGTYYRTRLRAEIVFPSGVTSQPTYEEFSRSVGVINQLRGSANSKPSLSMHKYIVPLLEQPWVAQLIRPNHRPDDIFWLSDLSPESHAYLQEKNSKLFNARAFYEDLKNLDFPKRVEDKIMEGIDFPVPYVMEILTDISAREFDYHGGTPRAGIVTRTLKRKIESKSPDAELQQLLDAAEASLLRLGSKEIAGKYRNVGFELSTPRIQEILETQQDAQTGKHHLFELACQSLAKKIERQESNLEPVIDIVRQRLIAEGEKQPGVWPPQEHSTQGAGASLLRSTGVTLSIDQLVALLEDFRRWKADPERVSSRKYNFNLALESITRLSEKNQELGPVSAILEEIVLDPDTFYKTVVKILSTDAVELTEDQINSLLSEEKLLAGRTLAALTSLKAKKDAGTLAQPQKTLRIAQRAMLRLKEEAVVNEALPWLGLSTRSIIRVLSTPKINPIIRRTAIRAIKIKIDNGDQRARAQVFNAVKKLLMATKNKQFIDELVTMYNGHQHQYRLFQRFLINRLDWLTLDRNRGFLLRLIESTLPKDRSSYRYTCTLPKSLYRFLRKIVKDNLIEDNCSFLLKLLFDVDFNEASLKALGALLEIILDEILKDPKKLTAGMCDWYQNMPKGWGTTEHKTFSNKLPLSPKLLRQFIGLLKITQSTGDDCYLDLAVTIAGAMSEKDKAKLQKLTAEMVKGMYSTTGRVRYRNFLEKLLPRRRKAKHKRRKNG